MHEIAWPIIAASSVISVIILCAEEIKPSQCKLQSGQLSTNKEKSCYTQMRALKRKTLFLLSVTLHLTHHAVTRAQFWHRFPRGTTTVSVKS